MILLRTMFVRLCRPYYVCPFVPAIIDGVQHGIDQSHIVMVVAPKTQANVMDIGAVFHWLQTVTHFL